MNLPSYQTCNLESRGMVAFILPVFYTIGSMPRPEGFIEHPLSAPDLGDISGSVSKFSKPKYFDTVKNPQTYEALRIFVEDPIYTNAHAGLHKPDAVKYLSSYVQGILTGSDTIVEEGQVEALMGIAEEQNVILLTEFANNQGERSQGYDRVSLLILAAYFAKGERVQSLFTTKDFLTVTPEVIRELGSHDLAHQLSELVPVDKRPSLQDSEVFKGYFPEKRPSGNRYRDRLRKNRQE